MKVKSVKAINVHIAIRIVCYCTLLYTYLLTVKIMQQNLHISQFTNKTIILILIQTSSNLPRQYLNVLCMVLCNHIHNSFFK